MFILLVFSSIARKTTSPVTQVFAYVLTGFFVLMIMGTTTLLFTSFFLKKPYPIEELFGGKSSLTPAPKRDEKELISILQKKTDEWVDYVFMAQAANGGIKTLMTNSEQETQVWTTAQCLTGVLSSRANLEKYVTKIRVAFNYINNMRCTAPAEGWGLYDGEAVYTLTEINSWVTLAHIKSLESKTNIWNEAERQEILGRIERDLAEIKLR